MYKFAASLLLAAALAALTLVPAFADFIPPH